jgi:hypothetical protein
MGFIRFTKNVLNISALPDRVQNQATTLKALFDQAGVDIKEALNALMVELESSASASNIGADVASVATKTVQGILTAYEEAIADRYTKAEADTLVSEGTNSLVADLDVNLTTGVITVTKKDGTTETFDTALEKVPAKFEIVENSGKYALKVTNLDGTTTQTDVTNLMNIYNFGNSDTINFEVTGEGNEKTVVANIKANSIGLDKLSLTVVSTLEGYVNTAKDSATAAKTSETNARTSEINAANSANSASNKATEAAASANTAATKASEANKSAEEAKKWAEQAGGAAGDLSGYYTKAETDAKIEEAIEGIEMPESQGSIPKFVGTQENPIDFSDLFEGIGNATDGWYQGTKIGQCILGGYLKNGITEEPVSLSNLFKLSADEGTIIPEANAEDFEMLLTYEYICEGSEALLNIIGTVGKQEFSMICMPGAGYYFYNIKNFAYQDEIETVEKKIFTATIPTTGWTTTAPYYVDIAIEGMLEADLPHITPVYTGAGDTDKAIQEAYNKLDSAKAEDGYLRVTAFNEVPTTAIPIQIEVIR